MRVQVFQVEKQNPNNYVYSPIRTAGEGMEKEVLCHVIAVEGS